MRILRRILTAVTLLSLSGPCTKASGDNNVCESPQYLELGIPGIISCNLKNEYFAVFWTNSSDQSETPLVSLKKEGVAGRGYESGEFNIHENGSLVINLVTVEHEHVFTLLLFPTSSVQFDYYNVDVITTVHPSQKQPYISHCDSEEDVCLIHVKEDSEFQCSVTSARPKVDLEWHLHTKHGFKNVTGDKSVVRYYNTFSTTVTTFDVFHQSSMAVSLACVEVSEPRLLHVKESFLLALNRDYDISSTSSERKVAIRGTDVMLNCSTWNATFIVWNHRNVLGEDSKTIVYTLRGADSFISKPSSGYRLCANGSLMIDEVDIAHEGVYSCISGDGEREDLTNYNISIYVTGFPVVSGCSSEQYCVITTRSGTGTLTCKIAGIRPSVQLEFRAAQDSNSEQISFANPERIVHNKGNLFDVTLTSDYRVTSPDGETRITIECGVLTAKHTADIFGRPAKLDIHFIPKSLVTDSYQVVTTSETTEKFGVKPLLLLLLLVPCSAALVALAYYCRAKLRAQPRRKLETRFPDSEEMLPMFSDGSPDKIMKFINALKVKYESLYNAVHPLPYIRDRMYSVDKVFVESGIQMMKTPNNWVELESYHDIFTNAVNKFARTILEGEPGFGKSILSLQLLYDWCNRISTSPLKDVQIVIFLQLRQLGGIESISEAVKKFILPKDSDFREDEIKTILQNCSSIFIILDGFDEYPDQKLHKPSDVRSIIKGEMFQQASVLLTTRSKCIPKHYAPQSKRIRLDGFNNSAQRTYIQKAVVAEPARTDSILRRLNENTVVSDLCQVPLFFVMFAHMTHEDEEFQEFKSVSTCFRYVIGCFHAHLRNKSGDETLRSYESDHKELDQVAYEALNGLSQNIVWSRHNLLERIGEECYRYYVQVGILVEEEVLDSSHKSSFAPPSLAKYETKVRFFHKIVCEWYAAHYFSELISSDSSILKETQMNLFDLQYVFRFACGFSRDAADCIISYVSEREDGEKFMILCFLEQTGDEENILETITKLCSSEVIFDGSDTKLLQRSTVQLLEMASSNSIEIARVEFYNCVKSVDLNLGNLILSSDIEFHKLSSINQLVIYEEGKLVEVNKAQKIIKFGTLCHGLRTLAFYRCIMPQSLGKLHQNFSVWWSPSTDTRFYLTSSGGWETTDKKKLSTVAYKEEVRKFKSSQTGAMGNHTRIGEDHEA